jgi:peptide/nickel transport system permease protein
MTRHVAKSKFLIHFVKTPSAMFGALTILFWLSVAAFGPFLVPQNPYDLTTISLRDSMIPPIWMPGGEAPFLLGTDEQGRDILSTIVYGLRTSLTVGVGVIILAGVVGASVGILAGYYDGKLSNLAMRIADIAYSFPAIMVAILLMGMLNKRGLLVVILAISAITWVRYARTMRGKVLAEKNTEYILAAKAIGASSFRLIAKHLLPNCLPPLLVIATVDIAVVIMLESSLSYLGVGVPISEPSLGQMIFMGKGFVQAGKWWLVVFPGGVLITFILGINLLGDWMRVELSPRIRFV